MCTAQPRDPHVDLSPNSCKHEPIRLPKWQQDAKPGLRLLTLGQLHGPIS